MQELERLEGRHSVEEALKAGLALERLLLQRDMAPAQLEALKALARQASLRFVLLEKAEMDKLSARGRHQGIMAEMKAYAYASVSEILKTAREKGEDPFLILLDGIEDPHNLGAIIRTAHQAGAHGVIIPKNRSAGVNATVARVSAGALAYLPVAQVTNLSRTMEELKKEGLWFGCADMDGQVVYRQNLKGPLGLVIGSEGAGVSAGVKKHCDFVLSIPMSGKIDSLNASVAAGVLMYEVVRQRNYG